MRKELINAQQGHQVLSEVWVEIKPSLLAGKRFVLEVNEWTKTRQQEKFAHDIIGQIARDASHLGAKWDAKDWKRLLVNLFCKENPKEGQKPDRIIPSLDGEGIVQLDEQTRDFSGARYSLFIDWLLAWAANNGVHINVVKE